MAVYAVNLVIEKGTYFEENFTLSTDSGAYNLAGATAAAKLKKHPTAGIAYTFSTAITTSISNIKISMSNNVTATLPSGRCYYDVVVTDSEGLKTKVVEGTIMVKETLSV